MRALILADLTATDLTLILVTLLSIASVGALVAVLFRLLGVLQDLRGELARLDEQITPMVDELTDTLAEANDQLERTDLLVGSAEAISETVDATSKLAYRALSAPVIKTVAVTSGASRAARRLRRGS